MYTKVHYLVHVGLTSGAVDRAPTTEPVNPSSNLHAALYFVENIRMSTGA